MDYLDFEVRITPGSGRDYPVSVLQSPAGETSATMHFPFDTLALQNQLQGIEIAVLRSGGTRRDVAMDEHLGVSEFGRRLFEALMTDTVRETFRRSRDRARAAGKGLRIRLRIEAPELAALPWEYLYDPAERDFVCLSADTPVVRYLEFDRPPEALTIRPPLSILGLIASPNDRATLDVQREKQRIEASTAPLRKAGLLKLTWLEGSTWRDLQRAMRQGPYHIFHFVGHGGFDTPSNEGVIALTDDDGKSALMSATQLGRLLADHQSLRMVVLNSCLGAKGSDTDVFSSTASILVRRGVSAVVAMQYEISDLAAVEFARSLYEALADGMPVDAAVAEARKAISLSVNNTVEWGTPVLHMRSPDGMLFRIDGMTTSKARASGTYPSVPALKMDAPPPSPAPPTQSVAPAASSLTTVPSVPPLKPAAPVPPAHVAPVTPVLSGGRAEPTMAPVSGSPGAPPPRVTATPRPLAEPTVQANRSAGGAAVPPGAERPAGASKKPGRTVTLLLLAAIVGMVALVVYDRTRRGSISIEVQEPAKGIQLPPEWTSSQAEITAARFIAVSDTTGKFSIVVGHILRPQEMTMSVNCDLAGAVATIWVPINNAGGEYSGTFQVQGPAWLEGPRHAKCTLGRGTIWEGDVEWTRPPGSAARESAAASTSDPAPEPTPATQPRALVAAPVNWASTHANLRQLNASFLRPLNWQITLTVDYTAPKTRANAMVDCSLRKDEPEQMEILVEVPLLPGRRGGDYTGLVQTRQAWGAGPYRIQCQVDGAPVYEGMVSWPVPPEPSAPPPATPPPSSPPPAVPALADVKSCPSASFAILGAGNALGGKVVDRYAPRGYRCEGFADNDQPNRPIVLASLTSSFETQKTPPANPVYLTWAASAESGVTIRARSFGAGVAYRMDVSVPAGWQDFQWPTDVLSKGGVFQSGLGVLGWSRRTVGGATRNVYLPLRLSSVAGEAGGSSYTLVLLPRETLSEVHVLFGPAGSDGQPVAGKLVKYDAKGGPFAAFQPIRITLSAIDPPGLAVLQVSEKRTGLSAGLQPPVAETPILIDTSAP